LTAGSFFIIIGHNLNRGGNVMSLRFILASAAATAVMAQPATATPEEPVDVDPKLLTLAGQTEEGIAGKYCGASFGVKDESGRKIELDIPGACSEEAGVFIAEKLGMENPVCKEVDDVRMGGKFGPKGLRCTPK
jgi:hypothetical protein